MPTPAAQADNVAMSLIAGSVDVHEVIDRLRAQRPVFHSEADFQHAFAWVLHQTRPALNIRLEVRQHPDDSADQRSRRERVDLYCFGPHGHTFLEFKYFTARWDGTDPATGEQFRLRAHTATDLARRGFVFDLARVERFCAAKPAANGFAIMLTNDRALWTPPSAPRITRDQQFRIHEGLTLTGVLRWGIEGSYFDANERQLSGSYPMRWHEYSALEGTWGTFRWLSAAVEAGTDTSDG
jgi:hypothetical protein